MTSSAAPWNSRGKTVSLGLLALFFVAAGANHFIAPSIYREIMPAYLPQPEALVAISGAAEIFLGCAVLIPLLRGMAGWGLIALLCAVFPANIDMALHGFRSVPAWVLWARLPLQLVFIGWTYWSCLHTGVPVRHQPASK